MKTVDLLVWFIPCYIIFLNKARIYRFNNRNCRNTNNKLLKMQNSMQKKSRDNGTQALGLKITFIGTSQQNLINWAIYDIISNQCLQEHFGQEIAYDWMSVI